MIREQLELAEGSVWSDREHARVVDSSPCVISCNSDGIVSLESHCGVAAARVVDVLAVIRAARHDCAHERYRELLAATRSLLAAIDVHDYRCELERVRGLTS